MTPHAATVLRCLRNGLLLATAVSALVYVWVAVQARHELAAVHQTEAAVMSIDGARTEASQAQADLTRITRADPALTGTGAAYVNDITQVIKDITLVAENNTAATEGISEIQYVSGELETYLQLSENVVLDYSLGESFGLAADGYAETGSANLTSAIGRAPTCQTLASQKAQGLAPTNLAGIEQSSLCAQLNAWPLDPVKFWPILLAPVIAMLLIATATALVLARHFRCRLGPWLWGAVVTAVATTVTVGAINMVDEQGRARTPLAGSGLTITVALVLFLAVALLAYRAYRPRLAEYRFRSS